MRTSRQLRHKSLLFAASGTTLAMFLSLIGVATAATTDPNPSPREIAHAALSRQAAGAGMVLLENSRALPMASDGTVAVFGVGAYDTVKGGTGSGDVNNRDTVTVREGLEQSGYTVTTSPAYWDAMVAAYTAAGDGRYAEGEVALTAASARPIQATDTALYVLARNSGEGSDRSATAGDYYLTNTELGNLRRLGQTYRTVVVALNVGAVVDTTFFRQINRQVQGRAGQALDAMLLMSQPGQEAGLALVDVLNGTVSPSGKTVDTWAASYDYYPAADTFSNNDGRFSPEIYSEGVYVGYRYLDSFHRSLGRGRAGRVVNYPFGYGLSYTDFELETRAVRATARRVTVRVKVTNTGRRSSGREVVQVYFSAPQRGLDKPYQELAGYVKTDVLAPGASQMLRVSFPTREMSSYDETRSAYVLDRGDYLIRVGNSSRSTSVAAVLTLNRRVVTEQLSTQLVDDQTVEDELTSDPDDFYSYRSERREVQRAPGYRLRAGDFRTRNNASPLEQDVPVSTSSGYYPLDGRRLAETTAYTTGGNDWNGTGAAYQPKTGERVRVVAPARAGTTLFDVAKGSISMERFVAGLSVEQLANIVEGASPGTDITPGVAGTTTARYQDLGIPSASLVDGPAGIRINQRYTQGGTTYYQYATAWPIGTLLAQTWDAELIERVGAAVATEMIEFGVAIWLAPGMNLHRDPLNGRNFEYFSEDPLVTGLSASWMTQGVQSRPGVGVTIKHLAANQQELQRQRSNSVIGERALRELYLKGFEIAVKSTQPMAVMTSYNLINGTAASGNYDLATDVLRGEWGYAGTVMVDWGANYNVNQTVYSGNDLLMPGAPPAEIIDRTVRPVDPIFDLAGLPIYQFASRTSVGNYIGVHQWRWGTFVAAPGGSQTYSTTVDSTTDFSRTPQTGTLSGCNINFICPNLTPITTWTSVDAAYRWVTAQLDPNAPVDPRTIKWLTPENKAAIQVTVNSRQNPSDPNSPVTSYTVTIRGEHGLIRLGDLQRSASRVLETLTHTLQFAELAERQGVTGITLEPYTQLFADQLISYLRTRRGPVVGRT